MGIALPMQGVRLSFSDYSVFQSTSVSATRDQAYARALDVTISLILLVAVAPLMALVGLMVYATNPGPMFFGHVRIGRGGRNFRCFKFRSMVVDAETRLGTLLASDPVAAAEWARDHKLRDDPRITSIGRFLRQTSLDELPQLFNVLRGEMSLVGPRPIVRDEIGKYRRYFREYCEVRPGITGLWQVSGRNDVSYRRRVAMDVAYVRSQSIKLYLRILILTIPSVLRSRGSY